MDRDVFHENIVCTACSCVCDDLRITTRDSCVISLEKGCELAEPFFRRVNQPDREPAFIGDSPSTVMLAAQQAAQILSSAKAPLIHGLSRSSTHAQRQAVLLADLLNACIDTPASYFHSATTIALQQVGESTCSLGEVRNRADLVLFWGCDPQTTHPRLFERFVGQLAEKPYTVVLDESPSATSANSEAFIAVSRESNFETVSQLRQLIKEQPAETDEATSPGQLRDLAGRMKKCRCGVVFVGPGLTQSRMGHRVAENLFRLVAELNAHTAFYAMPLRNGAELTGAENVLCWQTGYPFAVNFNRGWPRHNVGEFSTVDMLIRQEVDACLLIGGEHLEKFPDEAIEQLSRIPTILLDHVWADPAIPATVRVTTAHPGLHQEGTAYRMDEVPLTLRPVLSSKFPTDGDVLEQIVRFLKH